MHSVVIARGIEHRQAYAVAERLSVRTWVNLHVGSEFPAPMLCLYQGRPLPRAQWDITLIEADVMFVSLPLGGGGGGGKNPLAIIGMAIVTVAAIVTQQYWALPATASAWGISATTAGVIGYLSAAAIMIGGSLMINALFPTRLPALDSNMRELESASPTYSLTASGNQARLYQMIPESFGRMQTTPDLGAQPWLEFQGNEQYLHQLLVVGMGEYAIHSVSIEDTAIWEDGEATGNFPEIEIEIVNPGERITLFPDNIESAPEVTGQVLNKETIGPFTANSAGTQTTALAIDVIFTRGLGYLADTGGISAHGVSVYFEYRYIDDSGTPIGDWQELLSKYYSAATQTPQRHTHIVKVPAGRYQVQGRVTGGGGTNSRVLNECAWGGLKAYLPSKLTYPDVTLIAVRARATNALSQSAARQFQVLHTRKLPSWNPNTGWSDPTPTSSWSWAMAAIAKAPWGGRRGDRQIDLDALYRLDQELSARGDEFCQVLDTRQTVWDLVSEACRCVRAIPRAMLSTLSWMRDGPDRPVRGVFTPYNIVRNSFSVDYAFFSDESPDDVIVEYRDRDGWIERDVRASLPDSLSVEPARKRFTGITSRPQAYREACFETACNAYRRIFLKWSTEMEGRLLFRGDMVLVTHPLGGEGHWAAVSGWKEEAASLDLDTTLPWEEENSGGYYAVLRKPNGMPYGPVKVAGVGRRSLTLDQSGLAEAEAREAAGSGYVPIWQWLSDGRSGASTTVTFGLEDPGVKAIVLSVAPRENGICDIEAVIEDERVHTADQGDVPPWTPGGEVPAATMRPVITGLTASYAYSTAMLTLAWDPDAGTRGYQVQYRSYDTWQESVPKTDSQGRPVYETIYDQWGNETGSRRVYETVTRSGWSEWNDLGELPENARTFPVPQRTVEYRVRGLSDDVSGFWNDAQADCSAAMPTAVALALAAPYIGGNLSLQWEAVAAQSIIIVISSGNIEYLRKTVAGDAATASVTAAEMQAVGGPWRDIDVVAISTQSTWESRSDPLEAMDAPPSQVQGLTVAVDGSTAHVSWQAVAGDDVTGYGLGQLTPAGDIEKFITDAETTSMDVPVNPGDNTFTVGAKDALFDLIEDESALNFSERVTVEAPA